ncbi:MAG: hypothetical protein A2161_03565, partial [Candidatus Schekmanbacteria bacterium RBG_13_48_7]
MVIGSCQLDLHIPCSHSLKDKRQVIKQIIKLVKNRYNVSISEIDNIDLWQRALLGFVTISNEKAVVESILQKVRQF